MSYIERFKNHGITDKETDNAINFMNSFYLHDRRNESGPIKGIGGRPDMELDKQAGVAKVLGAAVRSSAAPKVKLPKVAKPKVMSNKVKLPSNKSAKSAGTKKALVPEVDMDGKKVLGGSGNFKLLANPKERKEQVRRRFHNTPHEPIDTSKTNVMDAVAGAIPGSSTRRANKAVVKNPDKATDLMGSKEKALYYGGKGLDFAKKHKKPLGAAALGAGATYGAMKVLGGQRAPERY